MSTEISRITKIFHLFLGFHSLLLGLFPFFLPVYLLQNGAAVSEICWFITATGIGFTITLFLFDRLRSTSFFVPVVLSFFFEGLLLWMMQGEVSLLLIGLVNGAYSCLYWTIQRIFFLAGGTTDDSGRRFGNFQIYVLVVLKIGIFIGSLLLENIGIWAVSLLTVIISGTAILLVCRQKKYLTFPVAFQAQSALRLTDILLFNDSYRSRQVFTIDGIFLYFESYFWVISLFLVVGKDFVRLGGLVIVLALLLGLVFYLIKNRIDNLDRQKVYRFSVVLYMVSWLMRGSFSESMGLTLQIVALLLIAFCTSFFRLTFNKRFFDIAESSSMYHYILQKSYYSQIFLALSFGILGLISMQMVDGTILLSICYWVGFLLAAVYFRYLPALES